MFLRDSGRRSLANGSKLQAREWQSNNSSTQGLPGPDRMVILTFEFSVYAAVSPRALDGDKDADTAKHIASCPG